MRGLGLLLGFLGIGLSINLQAQTDRPKLVVGIVVDQMRQEYIYRYYSKFGAGGFRRLVDQGFMLKNAHYNYMLTVTGPGHASVYSGTTPANHGIISNEYFDKATGKMVNCVFDPAYLPVGNPKGNGDVSPSRLLSTTITDELKLFTQKRAKVIGISHKDRGAVLPAGHMADAAYWYDSQTGMFITSTYYRTDLPAWLQKFHDRKLPDQYLNQVWDKLYPKDSYAESGPDDSPYERKMYKDKPTFPYDLKAMKAKGGYDVLVYTPFANDYLTEMALATIDGESMGRDSIPDFLAISYSSTDIIGHSVGPNAQELEDVYLRLDRNIETLLKALDSKVGAGNYSLFLTADHAVADVPQYLKDNKVPAGYFSEENAEAQLKGFLAQYFPGKDLIANISNNQVFLNHSAFRGTPQTQGIDLMVVSEMIGQFLMSLDGVYTFYTESALRQSNFNDGGIKGMVFRGYHPRRSGDITFVLQPGWFESGSVQGTTHGSPYTYDTHIPVLFYGKGIKAGNSVEYHTVTDIAPTMSVLLSIKFPNASTGQPVAEAIK